MLRHGHVWLRLKRQDGRKRKVLCDKDDFLLIVEQWLTESASVLLMLELFDEPESPFLGLMLRGVIASIDHNLPGFSFRSQGDDSSLANVVIHLDDWQIGYADRSEFAKMPNQIVPEIQESFTLSKPGISIAIAALTDK